MQLNQFKKGPKQCVFIQIVRIIYHVYLHVPLNSEKLAKNGPSKYFDKLYEFFQTHLLPWIKLYLKLVVNRYPHLFASFSNYYLKSIKIRNFIKNWLLLFHAVKGIKFNLYREKKTLNEFCIFLSKLSKLFSYQN